MAKLGPTKREPTDVQIADRAYSIYGAYGGGHGHDVGDWFEAERQLRQNVSRRSGPSSERDHRTFTSPSARAGPRCEGGRRTEPLACAGCPDQVIMARLTIRGR